VLLQVLGNNGHRFQSPRLTPLKNASQETRLSRAIQRDRLRLLGAMRFKLATRDPDAALAAAAARVVDWAGGTRIGESLKAYNDEWGRRALTRGAIVVVLSDGCERGGAELVRSELERLARQAFAVVWVNPLKAHPEYEPLAAGMAAALPYVDRLVSGHDVASLEVLGSVLRGIERRHQA